MYFLMLVFSINLIAADQSFCPTQNYQLGLFNVSFSSKAEAQIALSTPDIFTESMNDLNRALRLMVPRPVTSEEYFTFTREQALCWNQDEIEKIKIDLNSISNRLSKINEKKFKLKIKLLKTSSVEEGGAYYTRSNYIAIRRGQVPKQVLAHEIYHLFSRANPQDQDILFKLVGFVPGETSLPYDLEEKIIVNPDAPILKHMINIEHNGQIFTVVPLITSKVSISEINSSDNDFFNYIDFRLYSSKDDRFFKVGETNYVQLTGGNTGYIIHPEEIMADNFSFLITDKNVPNQELLLQIENTLKNL